MANRPYKELSEIFVKKVRALAERGVKPIDSPKQFDSLMDTMLYNIHNHLSKEGSEIEDIRDRSRISGSVEWVKNLGDLRTTYKALHNRYTNLTDEESSIYRIERKSHLTALLFRFFTTLAIGFAVLIIYWIASKLNIPMPLIRVM